ncbi:M28 family metallopeptidase [Yeosuana marina]|uniref:M28 family metallopeptidase n=1 Tax=Yeosuana marina TaxID=1565536 RepID=UPI0014241FD8|nr:M20/M25/M40 family metallo-hydrolase [Yeosuana marina]
MKKILLLFILSFIYSNIFSQTDITESELKEHLQFLTSDKNAGRYPGGKENRWVVKYIKKEFKNLGIKPFKTGYEQNFKAELRVDKGEKPVVKTCNVIGFIEGNDPVLKNYYIVLGAHYDHLGFGGPSAKSDKRGVVYHGADDNASGTSALLEIAEKLAAKKSQLKRSVLFIAFGAEEQGLLGSKYFVEHPTVSLSQIKLMINLDMVGRLNSEQQVYMGGAGTFPGGVKFMTNLGTSLGLNPVVHAGSVGGSDHVSFYKKGISVLGIHTGGHPQYHRPEDTIDLINLKGEKQVCEYVFQTILQKASSHDEMSFINQD